MDIKYNNNYYYYHHHHYYYHYYYHYGMIEWFWIKTILK